MKVLFRKSDGRLLGAQALGEDGVDERISALAGLIQMGATVYDLEESELCYAPQYGSAKETTLSTRATCPAACCRRTYSSFFLQEGPMDWQTDL